MSGKLGKIRFEVGPSFLGPAHVEAAVRTLFGSGYGIRWLGHAEIEVYPSPDKAPHVWTQRELVDLNGR